MKTLTFKEVIANIKEGEVWESCDGQHSNLDCITKENGRIKFKFGASTREYNFWDNGKFRLQRKKYTFEKAFKAFEEGKEIESFKGISYIKHYEEEYDEVISIEEIRGKWYIND